MLQLYSVKTYLKDCIDNSPFHRDVKRQVNNAHYNIYLLHPVLKIFQLPLYLFIGLISEEHSYKRVGIATYKFYKTN